MNRDIRNTIRVTFLKISVISCLGAISCLSLSSPLFATGVHWQLAPYAGMDAQVRHMKWASGFGDNIFRNDYPQGNVYAGLKLHNYLGIELGYELTAMHNRQVALGANNQIFGQAIVNPPNFWSSKFQIKGWHAGVLGFFPILCKEYKLELIAGVGISRTKIFHSAFLISDAVNLLNPLGSFTTFTASKSLAKLSFGAQHMFSECYGLRFLLGWLNTNRFGRIVSRESPRESVDVNSSWQYGLGLFVKF